MRIKTLALVFAAALTMLAPGVGARDAGQAQSPAGLPMKDHYQPYAFLIGDWDSNIAGPHGGFSIRQSFRWGPERTYIEASAYVRPQGQAEQLHFEGIMTWNEARQSLDFLFMHEPGTGGQEAGIAHLDGDGAVVREITETDGHGVIGHERQIWRRTGPNTAETSMMHQTADGAWAPNFPGADLIPMTRRPG
jgi:hypothetical protein